MNIALWERDHNIVFHEHFVDLESKPAGYEALLNQRGGLNPEDTVEDQRGIAEVLEYGEWFGVIKDLGIVNENLFK